MAHQAGAYPGFSNMRRPGVLLLPTGWDAQVSQYPFIHLGAEGHCESKSVLPKNTTQCLLPGLEPRPLDPETSAKHKNHEATEPPMGCDLRLSNASTLLRQLHLPESLSEVVVRNKAYKQIRWSCKNENKTKQYGSRKHPRAPDWLIRLDIIQQWR